MPSEKPFVLIKRKKRRFYYVRFKQSQGGYGPVLSTGEETESKALAIAWQWYTSGVPSRSDTVTVEFKNLIQNLAGYLPEITQAESKLLADRLRSLNVFDTVIEHDDKGTIDFGDFLLTFWDFDNSDYIKRKNGENHDSIHKRYALDQKNIIENYWIPFFKGRKLGEINRALIKAFRESLNGRAGMRLKPLSPGRKQNIMLAGGIPLKFAVNEGKIPVNPSLGLIQFAKKETKTQILSPEMTQALFNMEWPDDRIRLANQLAAFTGMRANEIAVLQKQDIGSDCIFINHSFNFIDGVKKPKNNEERIALAPPELLIELHRLAGMNPFIKKIQGEIPPDTFIFSADTKNAPMDAKRFLSGLRAMLRKCGLSKEESELYRFHDWRHLAITLLRNKGIPDKIIMMTMGHKSLNMLKRYSNHELAGELELLRQAQTDLYKNIRIQSVKNETIIQGPWKESVG